jgi:hypothetical protein
VLPIPGRLAGAPRGISGTGSFENEYRMSVMTVCTQGSFTITHWVESIADS